jgi:hypothetical protein
MTVSLPAILIAGDTPELLINSSEINECHTLDALKQLIKDRLPAENSH